MAHTPMKTKKKLGFSPRISRESPPTFYYY
jgi:hypothetical protein